MESHKIMAGIVTYNPDLKRLRQNINAILSQVDSLVIVDNKSDNVLELKKVKSEHPNAEIIIIELGNNLGIAAAQNRICQYAQDKGYQWVITLDQDTVPPTDLVIKYMSLLDIKGVGMVCPKVVDRNFGQLDYLSSHKGIEKVDVCIASASAINLKAWEEIEGFYEPLFIDCVDFDVCMSLREKGYKILRNNDAVILHEVGHSKKVYFAGKERIILNHSALRYYYIIRNGFIVGKRHGVLMKFIKTNIRIAYQVNRYENNRLSKNKMMLLGLWHGITGREGKL